MATIADCRSERFLTIFCVIVVKFHPIKMSSNVTRCFSLMNLERNYDLDVRLSHWLLKLFRRTSIISIYHSSHLAMNIFNTDCMLSHLNQQHVHTSSYFSLSIHCCNSSFHMLLCRDTWPYHLSSPLILCRTCFFIYLP